MAAEVVVSYSEEYAAAHANFAARNWPHNELRRDPCYNRWKYRAQSIGPVEGWLLAIQDGRVVGQVGLTPVLLSDKGANFRAQWFSDFMVEPAYRLRGIGPLLVARAVSAGVPTLADAPTSQSEPVLKAMGFRELKGPKRMHLPLAPRRVSARVLQRTILQRVPGVISAAGSLAPIYLAWRTRKMHWRKNFPVVTKCRWAELADYIGEAQRKIAPPHVVHDATYLTWRSLRFGEGLAGMHGLRTAAGGYVLFGKHNLCLYVFDWAASSEQECSALFAAARSAGEILGADSLSVLANSLQEREWLKSLGFFASQKEYEIYCYSPENFPFAIECLHCCHCDAHANL